MSKCMQTYRNITTDTDILLFDGVSYSPRVLLTSSSKNYRFGARLAQIYFEEMHLEHPPAGKLCKFACGRAWLYNATHCFTGHTVHCNTRQ